MISSAGYPPPPMVSKFSRKKKKNDLSFLETNTRRPSPSGRSPWGAWHHGTAARRVNGQLAYGRHSRRPPRAALGTGPAALWCHRSIRGCEGARPGAGHPAHRLARCPEGRARRDRSICRHHAPVRGPPGRGAFPVVTWERGSKSTRLGSFSLFN